jgi:hypothetical protein
MVRCVVVAQRRARKKVEGEEEKGDLRKSRAT